MLAKCYLVHGGEPQQTEEIITELKQQASQSGFSNQLVFEINAQFAWDQLLHKTQTLDLFAEGTLFELRLHGETVNKQNAQLLEQILLRQDNSVCIIIRADQLKAQALNASWAKHIQQHGQVKVAKPIPSLQWPTWVRQRLKQAGFSPSVDALNLLAQAYEGNVPALIQCIGKLHDLLPSGSLDPTQIQPFLHSDTHFSVFILANAILAGDSERVFIVFNSLQKEGVDPILILWVVTREIRKLLNLKYDLQVGKSLMQSAQDHGVWRDALPNIKVTLDRITVPALEKLLRVCKSIDSTIKGISPGNAWDALLSVCLQLTNNSHTNLTMEESPI